MTLEPLYIAYETHIKRSIVENGNRIKALTIIGIVYALGSMIMQIALPAIVDAFHGTQQGFIIIAAVTGIFGIITCIVAFVLCPEYSLDELAAYGGYDVTEAKEKVSLRTFLRAVLKNKYIFMWTVINFIYMLILMSSFLVGQYYFQFNYGNLSAFSIVMATGGIMLPLMALIPKVTKRFGGVNLIKYSMIISIGGIVLRMLFPHLLVAQAIGYLCVSIPNMFVATIGSHINFECMEYGRYKTGVIAEAMYSAFISFSQKMATSLTSVIIGVVLSKSGFDLLTSAIADNGFKSWKDISVLGEAGFNQYVSGGANTVARAYQGINFLYNIFPMIMLAICAVVLFFFHLERDLKKMRLENGLNEDGSLPEA